MTSFLQFNKDHQSAVETIDYIHVLLQQEKNEYNNQEYNWLSVSSSSSSSNTSKSYNEKKVGETSDGVVVVVDAYCRTMMIEWYYSVIETLQMNKNTVEIAVSYLDRFMMLMLVGKKGGDDANKSTKMMIDRSCFQLIAITCLYMSIKTNEPIVIDVQTMARFSNGLCTHQHLERMESIILQTLDWRMNPPTTTTYVHAFMDLLLDSSSSSSSTSSTAFKKNNNNNPMKMNKQDKELILNMTLLQTQQYVTDTNLYFTTKQSMIAYCSFMNSLESYCSTIASCTDSAKCISFLRHIGCRLASIIGITNCNDPSIVLIQDQLYYKTMSSNTTNSKNNKKKNNDNSNNKKDNDVDVKRKEKDARMDDVYSEKSPRRVSEHRPITP